MRALHCEIFKDNALGDCSNGGISSKYNDVLVVCEEGNQEIDENNLPENLCIVEPRMLWGKKHYFVRPYAEANGVGWMYGGSIVDSSDGRWNEMSGGIPLHLHDRTESQEMYDILSR